MITYVAISPLLPSQRGTFYITCLFYLHQHICFNIWLWHFTYYLMYSYSIDSFSLLTVLYIHTMSFCLEDNSDILLLAGCEIRLNFIVFSSLHCACLSMSVGKGPGYLIISLWWSGYAKLIGIRTIQSVNWLLWTSQTNRKQSLTTSLLARHCCPSQRSALAWCWGLEFFPFFILPRS